MIYIYGLVCPLSCEIRYIGKSIHPEKRLLGHIAAARAGKHNSHAQRWIRKLLREGMRPSVTILTEVSGSWQDAEREAIAKAKEDGWQLTNSTAGGDGLDFIRPEDAERWKKNLSTSLKKIWSTPEKRAEASKRAKNMHANPEQNARRIESLKAAWKRPEAKARLLAAMAEVRSRPEVKAKLSESIKANWRLPTYRAKIHNDISRAKMSEKTKARWSDDPVAMSKAMNKPERIASISKAISERNKSDVLKLRAKLRADWADPEHRANRLAAMAQTKSDPVWRERFRKSVAESWAINPELREKRAARSRDPAVNAKRSATLKETWARRKAAKIEQTKPA